MKSLSTAIAIFFLSLTAQGQSIDNLATYKGINTERFIRLNYENDFFTATDEYYTQGISLEVVSPAMQHNPLTRLLLKPSGWYTRYGLGIEHEGYTPTSVDNNDIRYGDRPFAGCLFLKTFQLSIDTVRNQRLSSSLSTGVIGPLAGAGQMQRDIHKWLHNYTPHGWDNQVQNDVIVNYQLEYERQIAAWKDYISFSGYGMVRGGTLSDKLSIGATLQGGYFDNPFSIILNAKGLRLYAYDHVEAGFIGYDATLQGGVFDRSSPYAIFEKNVTRTVFLNRLGVVLRFNKLYLEYFQSYLTPEFEGGKDHRWGGVEAAISF